MASSSSSTPSHATTTLHKRLLLDIAELQSKPYPTNITFHIDDSDLSQACLHLNADGYGPLHLTVRFPANYPLSPPSVQMNSNISHPNIFGSYICSSILNTKEGYTSAYTLKGIAIQLLSFFSSDEVEQEGGGYSVNLGKYKIEDSYMIRTPYACGKCDFAGGNRKKRTAVVGATYVPPKAGPDAEIHWPALGQEAFREKKKQASSPTPTSPSTSSASSTRTIRDMALPDEIILVICENLDTEELLVFASAWDRIGAIMTNYDLIRTRELQCFCLKTSYLTSRLGVGVSVGQGRKGNIESEFDLISETAFKSHRVRRSVQGVEFTQWLPLPISQRHWRRIQPDINEALSSIQTAARLPSGPRVSVIYEFMNSVVVKLNQQTSSASTAHLPRPPIYQHFRQPEAPTSSLTHASEKAIESYFHLFHLLLCLATSTPSIVHSANTILQRFSAGRVSKTDCPNLGHVLIASLISSTPMSERVIKSLMRETITRNIVWMLDSRGANMPELAYLEPSAVSEYRLQQTFEASKTSYRLLMFLRLFQRVAVGSGSGSGPRKSLEQLRDEAFVRHGAPPRGSARYLAESIKKIHGVSSFPEFLNAMGINEMPSKEWFTEFLRQCVRDSMAKGYSQWGLTQGEALAMRLHKEEEVEVAKGVEIRGLEVTGWMPRGRTFFPEAGRRGNSGGKGGNSGSTRGERGWRGGRGRGGA